ncbi:hypothetical protein Tco_1371502 [Tanacetum coccineum]
MVNTRTDAELAAAVQAAVDAMLPQIREQAKGEDAWSLLYLDSFQRAVHFFLFLPRAEQDDIEEQSTIPSAKASEKVADAVTATWKSCRRSRDDYDRSPECSDHEAQDVRPISPLQSAGNVDQRNRGQQSHRSTNFGFPSSRRGLVIADKKPDASGHALHLLRNSPNNFSLKKKHEEHLRTVLTEFMTGESIYAHFLSGEFGCGSGIRRGFLFSRLAIPLTNLMRKAKVCMETKKRKRALKELNHRLVSFCAYSYSPIWFQLGNLGWIERNLEGPEMIEVTNEKTPSQEKLKGKLKLAFWYQGQVSPPFHKTFEILAREYGDFLSFGFTSSASHVHNGVSCIITPRFT